MSIPLYLKLKGHSTTPKSPELFSVVSGTSIEYSSKSYAFTKIFTPESSLDELNESKPLSSSEACVIFMGPTGSGKTTTLRKVIASRLNQLQQQSAGVSMSAFEVSENKYLHDLLDGQKKEYNPLTFEKLLKKQKLDSSAVVDSVFSKRSTSKTPYNETSSRSCLVITFYWNNLKCTYIDLMGNEKFDKSAKSPGSNRSSGPHSPNSSGNAPISNIFANMNMSSITQLLTKKSVSGRSSNLVANLIFKNDVPRNVKVVLTLDQFGDSSLVKSSMNNIADLIQNFKLGSPLVSPAKPTSRLPSYARPTLSSSPTKRISGISKGSLSPNKAVLATSTPSITRKLNTPAKLKMIPSLNRASTAPKAVGLTPRSNSIIATPTRISMNSMNSSPVSRKMSGTDIGPPIKIDDLSPVQLNPRSSTIPKPTTLGLNSSPPKPILRKTLKPAIPTLTHKPTIEKTLLSSPPNIKLSPGLMKKPAVPRSPTLRTQTDFRKSLKDLQSEHDGLKTQYEEMLTESQNMKKEFELEVIDLKLINGTSQALLAQQKELMNSKLSELKSDFKLFRTNYGSFKSTIENLKISLSLMEEENMNLKDLSSIQSTELISINDQLELFQMNHSSLKFEWEKVAAENDNLKEKLMELEKSNLQLIERDTEKEVIILENTKELSERQDSILARDEQLSIKDQLIIEKNDQLDEKDRYIAKLLKSLAEKDAQLDEANSQINKRDTTISQRNSDLLVKDQFILEKEAELKSHEAQLVLNNRHLQSTTEKLDQTNEKYQFLQQQFQSQEETFKATLRVAEEASNEKVEQIRSLTEENDRLRKESEQLSYSVSTEIAIKDTQVLSLTEQSKTLQSEIESNEHEIKSLQEQVFSVRSELESKSKDYNALNTKYEESSSEVQSLNITLDQRLEEIAQLGNELRSSQYRQESKMEDLNDELANTSSELISKDDQIANLEHDRESLAAQVNDLKDQVTAATTHWMQKFESAIKVKDETIAQLRQELNDEINSPLLTNIDLFNTSLSNFTKPFDPADIFQDNILSQSSRDNSIMDNEVSSSSTLNTSVTSIETALTPNDLNLALTKKKVLAPSKMENYKTMVNAMSKEKKLKKKSKLNKYKVSKISTNNAGITVNTPKQKI